MTRSTSAVAAYFQQRGLAKTLLLLAASWLVLVFVFKSRSGSDDVSAEVPSSGLPSADTQALQRDAVPAVGRHPHAEAAHHLLPVLKSKNRMDPRCRVPLREVRPKHKTTTQDGGALEDPFDSLSHAFAKAWEERCQLDQDKFTILMTSSNTRKKQVKENLQRFSTGAVPSLAAVYLRWIGELPEEPLFDPETSVIPIELYHNANGSLNNRWVPIPGLRTAHVFSHDDDMFIDPEDFEWGWQKAKEFTPSFTSFVGRRWRMDTRNDIPRYEIGREGQQYGMGTSASWIHSAFMDVYTSHPSLQPIRDVVEETQNCEDIAMAFLVPYLTRLPPLLVNGIKGVIHYQYRKSMVSKDQSHWQKRDICSALFYRHFGEMPPERDYTIVRGLSAGTRKINEKNLWDA